MKNDRLQTSFMVKVVRVGEPHPMTKCDDPTAAVRYWKKVVARQSWYDSNKEQFVVFLVSTKIEIQGYSLVSIGSLNATIAEPREVFRPAIAAGAYGLITVHNHPSGHVEPSNADRQMFQRMNAAGELLAIRVLDHIIVVREGRDCYSFQAESAAIEKSLRKKRRRRSKPRAKK